MIESSVFVDVPGITRNGGYGVRYEVFRELAERWGCSSVLNAYVDYDAFRENEDLEYQSRQADFQSRLRDFGYNVSVDEVLEIPVHENVYLSSTAITRMATDLLTIGIHSKRVMVVSGDAALIPVVQHLRRSGVRVEVIYFQNESKALCEAADYSTSGLLVAGLLPPKESRHGKEVKCWGDIGSRIRGVCYFFDHQKRMGFVRYMTHINDSLWKMDPRRDSESPYQTAFLHESNLPDSFDVGLLPTRDIVLEFTLDESDKGKQALYCVIA